MLELGSVLTAIVTPFDERGRVNEASFVALMRHLADNGSDGFVVAGTTGEASTLSDEEQLALIELAVVRATGGQVDHRRHRHQRHPPGRVPDRKGLGSSASMRSCR